MEFARTWLRPDAARCTTPSKIDGPRADGAPNRARTNRGSASLAGAVDDADASRPGRGRQVPCPRREQTAARRARCSRSLWPATRTAARPRCSTSSPAQTSTWATSRASRWTARTAPSRATRIRTWWTCPASTACRPTAQRGDRHAASTSWRRSRTAIINIVDATNIERNLYLTMQLMELDVPMVLALNMMDEVQGNGGSVRVNEMEQPAGHPGDPHLRREGRGRERAHRTTRCMWREYQELLRAAGLLRRLRPRWRRPSLRCTASCTSSRTTPSAPGFPPASPPRSSSRATSASNRP